MDALKIFIRNHPVLTYFPDVRDLMGRRGVFVGYLTAFRILMVWVYDRAESLLLAVLMHVSLTASLLILNPLGISGAHLMTYSFVLSAALWIVVGAVFLVNRRRVSSPPFIARAA